MSTSNVSTGNRLAKGRVYNLKKLRHVGWHGPHGELDHVDDTYNCWSYFASGAYLGADKHGVEPLFVASDDSSGEVRVEIDRSVIHEYRNTLFDDDRVLECDPDGFTSASREDAIAVLERYRLKGKIVAAV